MAGLAWRVTSGLPLGLDSFNTSAYVRREGFRALGG